MRLESSTCDVAGGRAPAPSTPTALDPAPGPGAGTTIGWTFGDALSDPSARVVTITYSAVVADLPTVHRGDVRHQHRPRGLGPHAGTAADLGHGTRSTSASVDARANVTIVEPVLSIDKTVAPAPTGSR